MRLGSAKYILPFIFVLNPLLILSGPLPEVLFAVITAILGSILMACALEGYLYFYGKLANYLRVFMLIAGIAFLYPSWQGALLGGCILVGFIILTRLGILIAEPVGKEKLCGENYKYA